VRYYHLPLDLEKLKAIEFCDPSQRPRPLPALPRGLTLEPLRESHLPSAHELLRRHVQDSEYDLALLFTGPQHLGHVLLPRKAVVLTLVRTADVSAAAVHVETLGLGPALYHAYHHVAPWQPGTRRTQGQEWPKIGKDSDLGT
jgi:hypothetical protein